MKTKIIFASTVFALLVAGATADPSPAPPAAVAALGGSDSVLVTWAPSSEPPEGLAYAVYGRGADGHVEKLATAPAHRTYVEVRVGFGEYGVAAEVDGRSSTVVFAAPCVTIHPADPRNPVIIDEDACLAA